jgi:predicted nucleotidyltransferase
MKSLEELKKILTQHKEVLKKQFKVKNIAIFGSYVRGEQNQESDIDILVEFQEPVGFLFIHLADYLEEILGVRVDLLTPDAIKPNRRRYIMEDLVYV